LKNIKIFPCLRNFNFSNTVDGGRMNSEALPSPILSPVDWPASLAVKSKWRKFARTEWASGESRKMQKQKEDEEKNIDGKQKKSSVVIRIPSYQEVVESSQAKSTPPSLFLPSQSFSQAFAFVKSSEFYAPPPPPPQSRYTRF